jgi:Protein of unknown function (DUF3617)
MRGAKSMLVAVVVGVAAGAVAEALKIEPGLWSVTYTYSLAGKPPPDLLANLPPEKRAAMEQSWAAKAGQPQTSTSDTCITAEDLASGNAFADNSEDEECQRTMKSQTATKWSGVEHCTSDERVSDRDIEITAENPKSITGSMHGKDGDSQMHMTFTGKWIAAECGDED